MSQPPGAEQDDLYQDDSFQCIICSENWTKSGSHCKISLRCGHLFGECCIVKWIEKSKKKAGCPICLCPIRKNDLRRIKRPRIVVRDLAERNKLAKLCTETETEISNCKRSIESIKLSILMCRREYAKQFAGECTASLQKKYSSWRNSPVELSQGGGRVLSFDCQRKFIALSLGSQIQKIDLTDMSPLSLIPHHTGAVRDIKCSSEQGMMLSTGIDKTLRLGSTTDDSLVHTFALEAPGWCCAFDTEDTNLVYCGLTNDAILLYDIRKTNTHLQRLQDTELTAGRPIHSLAVLSMHGTRSLLCSNLENVYMWNLSEATCNKVDFDNTNYKPYSLSVDEADPHNSILVSLRKTGATRHIVGQLKGSTLNARWTFDSPTAQGSLARTLHISRLTGTAEDSVVCYADETNRTIILRNQAGETRALDTHGPVLDVKRAYIANEELLATLTPNHLSLFKYT